MLTQPQNLVQSQSLHSNASQRRLARRRLLHRSQPHRHRQHPYNRRDFQHHRPGLGSFIRDGDFRPQHLRAPCRVPPWAVPAWVLAKAIERHHVHVGLPHQRGPALPNHQACYGCEYELCGCGGWFYCHI